MVDFFYKTYRSEIIEEDDENITDQDRLVNKVILSGAESVYRILWKYLVRNNWVDSPGFPIKRLYQEKGMLACSFSKTVLQKKLGVGRKKLDAMVKALEDAKWIYIERKTVNGQKVFILGKWNGEGSHYKEELFKDSNIDTTTTIDNTTKLIDEYLNSDEFKLAF